VVQAFFVDGELSWGVADSVITNGYLYLVPIADSPDYGTVGLALLQG
jgi:hypothetical protein